MAQKLLFKTGENIIWMAGVGGFCAAKPLKATILLAKKWPCNSYPPYIVQTSKGMMRFALERDLRSEDGTRRVDPNKKPNPYARKPLKTNTANVVPCIKRSK